MENIYRMQVHLPAGVGVQQTRDGMLILTYQAEMVGPLRERLDQVRADLLEKAIEAAKLKKENEMRRLEMPKTQMQELDSEIEKLERQRASDLPGAMPLGVGAEGYQPPRMTPRSPASTESQSLDAAASAHGGSP